MNKHEVVAEHGKRLIVSRSDVVERNLTNAAVWPDDIASQRMWALSMVVQADRSIRFPAANETASDALDQQIHLAERVMEWVTGTNPQAPDG